MAILKCYYCGKLNVISNRDEKNKITCTECDEKQKNSKPQKVKPANGKSKRAAALCRPLDCCVMYF